MTAGLNSFIEQVRDVFSECYAAKFCILIVLLVKYDKTKKRSRAKGLNGYALTMNPNERGNKGAHLPANTLQ